MKCCMLSVRQLSEVFYVECRYSEVLCVECTAAIVKCFVLSVGQL